ncbi:MAG: hypothetical protein QW036_00845 [Zestosphaera sp.]
MVSLATIKVKVYPDLEKTVVVEVDNTKAKEVIETLKNLLNLQGQYVLVMNGRIMNDDEYVDDHYVITLVPIVESG